MMPIMVFIARSSYCIDWYQMLTVRQYPKMTGTYNIHCEYACYVFLFFIMEAPKMYIH